MSNKISTRETIVNRALEMYNDYGVEYVGVRELAKELGIKGGNITYYFPTKNDLLNELAERLTASNSEILERAKAPSLYGFMEMNKSLYFNQYQYRAFFLSLPLWLQQDIEFAKKYREGLIARRKSFTRELETLIGEGYLLPLSEQDLEPVLGALSATGRLWISEATIDGLIDQEEKAIYTYLRRMAGLLQFIATEQGKNDLQKFLNTLK